MFDAPTDGRSRVDGVVAFSLLMGSIAMAFVGASSPTVVLVLYASLFAPYFYFVRRAWIGAPIHLGAVVAVAVAVRVALAFAEPVLSDDIFRYVWEGRVSMAAHNPFYLAPASEVLTALRDTEIWPRVNHPEIPTIYPPMAQFAFALNAIWEGGTTSMRLIFVAVELAALGIVARWTRDDDSTFRVFALTAYALNPLVFVETAWSGHLDVLAWSSLILGCIVWMRATRPADAAHAGFWLGMSIATKFLGLMALAAIVLAPPGPDGWRAAIARRVILVAAALGIVGMSYLPYVEAGPNLFKGFGAYAATWRSNDGGFRVVADTTERALYAWAPLESRVEPSLDSKPLIRLEGWDETFMAMGLTKEWEGQTYPNTTFAADQIAETLGKLFALLVMGFALFWCLRVERGQPMRSFLILMAVLLFVAPTVHPWYVAWLVPFAALSPRDAPAPLVFSGASLAAYLAWRSSLSGGPWEVPGWVVLVEFGAVVLVAIAFAGRESRLSRPLGGDDEAA